MLARALFLSFAAATAIHIAWVMLHEPFYFDAWNVAVTTGAKPFSPGNFVDFWVHEYTHSNPRLGQPLTYLAYKLAYFAPIVTPLVFLALATAIVVLGTGRRPRTSRDLAVWTFAIGALWFALPQLGKTLFCSAYSCNYVYTAALLLWFLVPLRLQANPRWAPLYAVAGIFAGLCNEHTGPTLLLGLLLLAYFKRDRLAAFGAAGVAIGFAALFFAPGQDERYDGLANRIGMVGRMIKRGLMGNLDILQSYVLYAAPLLLLLAVVIMLGRDREKLREPLRLVAIALVAGTLMTMTIFASPKLGPRFYYVSMSLLLVGVIAVADAVLSTRQLLPLAVLGVLASSYAAYRTIPLYKKLHAGSRARMAALAKAPPGSVFVADGWAHVEEDWWSLGDDFRDPKKRELVASYFDLSAVVFRAYDPDAPLGGGGARLVPHYSISPASCLDEVGGFSLGSFKAFDIASLHREMKTGIAVLTERLARKGGHLDSLELVVELDDDHAKLPRKTLAGRWTPTRFEGYVGAFGGGATRARTVQVPKELSTHELLVYNVGGEARPLGADHTFTPWHGGLYWALACTPAECWVFAATRLGGR